MDETPATRSESQDGLDALETRLVWIFGSPRTGSSWLMKMLSERPEILTINETYLPLHLVPENHTVPDGEYLEGGARADDSNFFFARRYLHELRPELRELILRGLQRQVREISTGRMPHCVVIKEPNGSHGADTTVSLLPQSRMIFLLRDGRDVVDSMLDALLGENSWWRRSQQHIAAKITQQHTAASSAHQRLAFIRHHAKFWVLRTNAVQRAFASLPEERRLLVRYEQMLDDTSGQLDRIIRWLGVNVSPVELERITTRHAFDAIPESERGSGKQARAATPGLWRKTLSEEEQAALEDVMGEKLRELGYPTGTVVASGTRTTA